MLRHIVVFKFKDQASKASRRAAIERLKKFCGQSPLLAEYRIEESLDQRKGHNLVQNTLLKDGATIEQWRNDPKHKEFVKYMSQLADWLIADYEE